MPIRVFRVGPFWRYAKKTKNGTRAVRQTASTARPAKLRIAMCQNGDFEIQAMPFKALIENLKEEANNARAQFLNAKAQAKARAAKAELDMGPCFAAGTLVHTINGLVPIEQIKVGDLVLSKPEHGGKQSYKPVTQTFVHDFKEVMALQALICSEERDIYDLKSSPTGAGMMDSKGRTFKGTEDYKKEWIISTANHPFFVKKTSERPNAPYARGLVPEWLPLDQLELGDEIETFSNRTAMFGYAQVLHRTFEYDLNVAMAPFFYWNDWSEGGYLIDLNSRPFKGELLDICPKFQEKMPPVQVTVYNLEVADNHTYYVGEVGLWVHNKDTRLNAYRYTQVSNS